MDIMEAILTRRSVRNYKPDTVNRDQLEELMMVARHAPSGMNTQPWAFGIIQGADKLLELSTRAKKYALDSIDRYPVLARYKDAFEDPNYNLFYNASTLFIIYAQNDNPLSAIDCTLAAENVMLAAHGMELGSCWIGLSQAFLNSDESKKELGVPADYLAVAPLIIGHPSEAPEAPVREDPQILFWK